MPPTGEREQTVVFLRHGVAQHNFHGANLYDPALWDPPLTLQGRADAVTAGQMIQTWFKTTQCDATIDLIVTSPLTRCLQTATIAFLPPVLGRYDDDVARECHEGVREACGIHYPDKRRARSVLSRHWHQFDFHLEAEEDERWKPDRRETVQDVQARIRLFLRDLCRKEHENVVVVSHGVWIETMLRAYGGEVLGEDRVYNLDAFACQVVSQGGNFVRLQSVQKISR